VHHLKRVNNIISFTKHRLSKPAAQDVPCTVPVCPKESAGFIGGKSNFPQREPRAQQYALITGLSGSSEPLIKYIYFHGNMQPALEDVEGASG